MQTKLAFSLFFILFVQLLGSYLFGQASITTLGVPISENFNSFVGTGATLPANWTTSGSGTNGNAFQGTNQTGGTGGGWYGNGNMSYLGSGTATNGNATWRLQNNTGCTITSFDVSFVARLWRTGSNSPNCTITYSTNSTGTVPAAGALTAIGTFNDATSNIATGTTLSYTVSSISIPAGDYIYIRFIHAGNSNSDNIGWDDVTVTPYGTCINHTVTFDGNTSDGGSMGTQTSNTSTALTSNAFSKTGCTFIGWNTAANGSGTSYANGAIYNFSADITLFAQWNCGHTVTFDGNGSDGGSMSSQFANTTTSLSANAFTKTGCFFTGWNTAANGSGTSYPNTGNYSFLVDITLYAQWNCPPPTTLIISQYLEGTGNDKCIEIYNTTSSPINLTGYSIEIFGNGSSTSTSTINLSGTIAGCGTYVVCNVGATSSFISISDLTSGSLNFNGDDAIGIFNGGSGGSMLDLFGNIGNDPGTEWTGVSPGTEDGNFIRTLNYCSGVTTDPTGTGAGSFTTFSAANWTSLGTLDNSDLGTHTTNCCNITNTITTGTVNGGPFSVTCNNPATGDVTFTSTSTFNSGNVYTAQLSNSSGSFSSPISIGTLTSTANSGTITITIPAGTPTGSGYLIRIISSDPSVIGTSSTAFTITLSGGPCSQILPHVTSIIYDGCNTSCNEGNSEIVFVNTGDYSIAVNSANLDLNYTTGAPYDLLGSVVNQTANTTAINTSAGCPGNYVNAFGTTIPPNSTVVILPSTICTSIFSWDQLCGQGPIYIVYGLSGTGGDTWHTSGNFGNSSGSKSFEFVVTATDGNTYTTSYTYNAPGTASDGNYATYGSTPPGGFAATQGNFPNCQITSTVLSSDLIYYTGYNYGRINHIQWKTFSEHNNSHFELMRSADGINYETVTTLNGAGTTDIPQSYQYDDENPLGGINYYKLRSIDYDGTMYEKGVIAIKMNQESIYYNSITQTIELPEKSSIEIYSPDGKLILKEMDVQRIPFTQSGIFIVRDLNKEKVEKIYIK